MKLDLAFCKIFQHLEPAAKASGSSCVWRARFAVIQVASIEEALSRYEEHARKHLMGEIKKLPADAVLGCWCAPGPCHGDVIVKLWQEAHGRKMGVA